MKKDESAVSPVIGVMLMLVVTIIIAAVVSGFAGGLSSGTSTPPQVSFEVRINTMDDTMGGIKTAMTFEHLSGDPVASGDLEIITYYTLPANGTVIKHVQTAYSDPVDIYGWGSESRLPFLNDQNRVGYSSNPPAWFGNYTIMPGDILSTGNSEGTGKLLGFDIDEESYGFGTGSVVDVKILHTPSSKYVYDNEVIVL